MPYIRPEEVLSPKKHVGGVLEVIHDPGEGGMCVARILWDNRERVAIRWNGSEHQPRGNPVSRRQPTWFVIDDYAAGNIEQAARAAAQDDPNGLSARYREMANDAEREQEAHEWTEGLIGDATSQTR